MIVGRLNVAQSRLSLGEQDVLAHDLDVVVLPVCVPFLVFLFVESLGGGGFYSADRFGQNTPLGNTTGCEKEGENGYKGTQDDGSAFLGKHTTNILERSRCIHVCDIL